MYLYVCMFVCMFYSSLKDSSLEVKQFIVINQMGDDAVNQYSLQYCVWISLFHIHPCLMEVSSLFL